MEIRDPVHGAIHILDNEIPIIRNPFFQRLRNIKQLGLSEYVFPGGTHTRFLHSIGVFHIGSKAFDKLFHDKIHKVEFKRLKETFKLACLLHDIGHAPLSHATESAMPLIKDLDLPPYFKEMDPHYHTRQATHEDYTIKSIVDSSLSDSFWDLKKEFGIERKYIADLITGHTNGVDYFTVEGVNYFPILHQPISSEMDCDRMDYLLRDSYFCGVSYGGYDLDWLLDNLEVCTLEGKAWLGISERAVVTFDDFLLSRFHMFLMVYFHYKSVCMENLLEKYFETSANEYQIPTDIEQYLEHDDHYLLKIMRKSQNKYAKRIIRNDIPEKIYESFNSTQLETLKQVQTFLESEKIEYIHSSSKGRLSKYYGAGREKEPFSIKVVRKTGSSTSYTNIDEATDLYNRYATVHQVNRLHCDIAKLNAKQIETINKLIRQ